MTGNPDDWAGHLSGKPLQSNQGQALGLAAVSRAAPSLPLDGDRAQDRHPSYSQNESLGQADSAHKIVKAGISAKRIEIGVVLQNEHFESAFAITLV